MPRTSRPASDATARTRKKNSSIIVEATAVHLRGAPVIDVASLDALVDVAKKYETMIVEVQSGERLEYLLWDDGMVFRFKDVDPTAAEPAALAKLRWDEPSSPESTDVPQAAPTDR